MTCAEFKELVAALALGALEPEERALCEAHLAQPGPHEGCERAYAEAVETAARLSAALPPARPGPRVWQRIERRLGVDAAGGAPPRARPLWRERLAWGLAAAAAVAFFVTNERLSTTQREAADRERTLAQARTEALATAQASAVTLADCRQQVASVQEASAIQRDALALIDHPATRVVRLTPQPGKNVQAHALVNLEQNRAVLVSSALEPRPDRDYELWIIRGKAPPIPAGLVRFTSGGVVLAEFDRAVMAPGAPDALAVSLEPKGGSLTPTEILMVAAVAG